MEISTWVSWILAYLLGGQIFNLVYVWVYKPTPATAKLGLMGLFWPVILVLDLVLSVARSFGSLSRSLAEDLDQTKGQ